MRAARKIIIIIVLLAGISVMAFSISSRYERTDGPTLGHPHKQPPLVDQSLVANTKCGLLNYVKGPEKVEGWPYVTKQIVNDRLCGVYPDLYYPDSQRANIAIIITGSGVLTAVFYLAGVKIMQTKRRGIHE